MFFVPLGIFWNFFDYSSLRYLDNTLMEHHHVVGRKFLMELHSVQSGSDPTSHRPDLLTIEPNEVP